MLLLLFFFYIKPYGKNEATLETEAPLLKYYQHKQITAN